MRASVLIDILAVPLPKRTQAIFVLVVIVSQAVPFVETISAKSASACSTIELVQSRFIPLTGEPCEVTARFNEFTPEIYPAVRGSIQPL